MCRFTFCLVGRRFAESRTHEASQQCNKFFDTQPCLTKDSAECSTVELLVIRNDDLAERFRTAEDDVASILTFKLKSLFRKCCDTLRSEEHTSELQSLRHLVC